MEYPGARFTRFWRRLTFGVFLAAFFILAPTIVLYTTGYRYDWNYGLLRETGSVSVDVLPRNAAVSLDGLALPDRIPVRLKNITPHTYLLKITAPGYYDWTKEITVENRQTTYIKDISLLRETGPEFLTKAHVGEIGKPGNAHHIIFTDIQKDSTLIRRLNTQTGIAETLLVTTASTTIDCAPAVSWCTITESAAGHSQVIIFDADTPVLNYPDGYIDLHELVKAPFTKVQWDTDSSPIIYFSTQNTIYALPLSSRIVQTISAASRYDWYASGGTVWSLGIVTSTGEMGIFKSNADGITLLSTLNPSKISSLQNATIVDADGNEVSVTNGNNTFIFSPQNTWTLGTTHSVHSPFSNWLILYGPDEIWGKEAGQAPTLLYRTSEPLNDLFVLDQYNTLALLTAKKMTALFHYYLVAQDLSNKKIITAVADTATKNIYYADKDGLWQLGY